MVRKEVKPFSRLTPRETRENPVSEGFGGDFVGWQAGLLQCSASRPLTSLLSATYDQSNPVVNRRLGTCSGNVFAYSKPVLVRKLASALQKLAVSKSYA